MPFVHDKLVSLQSVPSASILILFVDEAQCAWASGKGGICPLDLFFYIKFRYFMVSTLFVICVK